MKNIIWLSMALGFLSLGNLNAVMASAHESEVHEPEVHESEGALKVNKDPALKKTEEKTTDKKVATENLFKAIRMYKLTNGMKDKKCEETSIKIDGQDIALPAVEDVTKVCALSVCSLLKGSLTGKKEMAAFNKGFKEATKVLCSHKKKHKKKHHKKDDDASDDESAEITPEATPTVPEKFSDYKPCWDEMVSNKVDDTKECKAAMKALIEESSKTEEKHHQHKKSKKHKKDDEE